MTDKITARASFEDGGWKNGLLGIAHDCVSEAQCECHPESDAYELLKKLADVIEQADIELEAMP